VEIPIRVRLTYILAKIDVMVYGNIDELKYSKKLEIFENLVKSSQRGIWLT